MVAHLTSLAVPCRQRPAMGHEGDHPECESASRGGTSGSVGGLASRGVGQHFFAAPGSFLPRSHVGAALFFFSSFRGARCTA